MQDVAVAGYTITVAVHLGFALRFWFLGRPLHESRLASRLMGAALIATMLWAAFEVASATLRDMAWPVGAAALDLLRYGLWLGFMLSLLAGEAAGTPGPSVPSWLKRAMWLVLAIAVALLWRRAAAGAIDDPYTRPELLAQLALPLLGLLFVEHLFRNLGDANRWLAKPVCLGLGIVFAFDVYLVSQAFLFGRHDLDAYSARGAVHSLAVPFLWVASRRRGDWIAQLQVSRTAAFHSATLVLAGIYLLFVSAIGYYVRYFGGSWGRALQIGLLFAAVALLIAFVVSGSLRSWLRVFVGKHFFSYRYDYREEWLRFTSMLSARGSPQEVGLQVTRALADIVECPAGSLWTRNEPAAPYTQAVRWNVPASDASEPADSAFCAFLQRTGWVVDLEQFRSSPRLYEGLALPTWLLGDAQAWLVVPLPAGDELLGFVLLAQPRTRVEINWEVLDLLKTASRQAASYLALMQATEALLEARKFDAFNRMSAFVVHDLKNIVTQLSLMLKNAERLRDNREFQQDMLDTVGSSLEKMRRLMLQLREGAAPAGSRIGVELEPIVRRLEAMARTQGRTLEIAALERLATRGHDERLERVLGHIVQNALDATPADGRVWLGVERHGGQVLVEIGDTGVGMSEEFMRERLFKPFSSTKGTGMGVGSYESAQYIREIGGSIRVSSQPGQGTLVTVLLPLFDSPQRSDLMPFEAG